MGLLSLFHGKKQVSPLDDDDDMGGPGALRNNERRARSEGGDGKQGRHGKDKQAGRAESYSKKKKKKRVIVMKFEAFMEVLLSKFEVFKRKHPSTFKAVMFVAMILEEGLYVYDLYTDVVVAKFFYDNSLLVPTILSIIFIAWHYVLLAALLTLFQRRWLMRLIRSDEDAQTEVEVRDEQQRLLVAAHTGAHQDNMRGRGNSLLYISHYMSHSRLVVMLLAPFVFLASFVINCAIVPVIDVFMLCFDLVAYLMTPKANDEDSNPLNNRFINFLLQYRTLRLPMEVLMQSLPQAILALVMWQFLKRHPPSSSTSSNEFSDFAVAQALVASLANLTVNGITLYLSTKVSGRTWMRYMVMACKFEGSAMLPPEWDDRTTSASTVIDGNYHALKLAQQMKILQTVVRRDTITLRTPGVEADATWMKAHNKSVGDVVIENRKMLEFLYEWDGSMKRRRLPSKIDDLSEAREVVHLNVYLHRIDELPAKAPEDNGSDMDISYEQLKANIASAPTEMVAMWLVSHRQIAASLVHVSLTRCNLDASYMLPERMCQDPETGELSLTPGPIAKLMASKQMKLLDLSNNPLFVLTRPDPAARLWDGGSAGGSQNGSVGSSKRGAVLSGRGGVGLTRFNHAFAAGLHNIAGHNDNGDSDCDSILYDYGWDVESAIEIFSSGLRENTALEELRLSCTSMHPDATLAVFSALAVDVDNMGARSNDVLESLDVSHNCLLKPLPVVEGAEGAATALKQQVEELSVMLHNLVALQRLNLSATFLTFEQMTVLMLGIPSAVDVNRVHDDTFLKARTNKVERDHGVVENTSLTELDLSEIPMGDKGLEEVIQELLKGNKKLRTLLLRAIGQARTVGMQALAEVLQTNQHLQVLDLSKNAGIKDEGAQKLAYALMHNNRHAGDGLLSINMSSTSLTAFGVEALCQGLAAMSSLVAFDLSNSHLDAGRDTHTPREWTIAAAKAIGTVLRCNPGLRFLSLSRCHISAAGAGQLAYELDNPQYDAGNSALQHLDLGYNPLGEDGVKEIVIALQSHRQLQTLSLAAVNLTTVGLSEVLHQFERNASLEELDLTHNFIKTVNPKAFASFNANNTTLRRIDLRWNRIEESECAALGSLFTLEAKTAALATMGEAKSLRQQLRDLLNLDEEAEEAPYVLCV